MSRVIDNPQQLILGKAKEILYNEGYQKLTMRNVSKACDIALGTIYNYYPTKKELVIEMMTDYWNEYIYKVQNIVDSSLGFYEKLNSIFNDLSAFLKTFKETWLKPELYDKHEFIEDGIEREDIYIEKLVIIVKGILEEENKVKRSLDSYEIAKFIIMNFITIIQMPGLKYSSFETILRELLN